MEEAAVTRSRAVRDFDGSKLRVWRRQVRMLTQDELADAATVSRGEISHLETGRRKPLATTLRNLCIALECEPGDLLAEAGTGTHEENHAEERANVA